MHTFGWRPYLPRTSRAAIRAALSALAALTALSCSDSPAGPADRAPALPGPLLFLRTWEEVREEEVVSVSDVYRMNPDGTGLVNLTQAPGDYRHLSLSPDGRKVAFAVGGGGPGFGIWVMHVDGTGLVQLTNRPGADDGANAFPRWSPDGSMLAFSSNREMRQSGDVRGLPDVYVMRADGSDPRNVSVALGEQLGSNVHVLGWSPEGEVVFETDDGMGDFSDRRTYLVRPDGTGLRPLFDRAGDHSPKWSPDGSRIAFISPRDGQDRLYVMDADGSNARPLTSHAGYDRLPVLFGSNMYPLRHLDLDPWSPDGTRIAFERWDGADLDEHGALYVVNVDGTGLRRLSAGATAFNSWSPDGEQVAYTKAPPGAIGQRDVWVVGADGTGPANLTDDPADDTDALWLPRP